MKAVEEKFQASGRAGCASYDISMDLWRIPVPLMMTEDRKYYFITREILDDMLDAREATYPPQEMMG